MNGNGYWLMVIRIQQSKKKSPELIQVPFSAPCGNSMPIGGLPEKPKVLKFSRLFRMKSCDAVLQEYMPGTDIGTGNPLNDIPIWKYAPGMENEKLPFGKVVPCYGWDPLSVEPLL